MLMLYFGLVIVIYADFNNNIKQLNEIFGMNLNNFKCEVKNLELMKKKNFLWFSKDYISHQKKKKESY
jgi:hypothetical protein